MLMLICFAFMVALMPMQNTRVSNMMTRKDYVSTAEILKTYAEAMDLFFFEDLVNDFADMFAEDNARFNRVRFVEACNWLADERRQGPTNLAPSNLV